MNAVVRPAYGIREIRAEHRNVLHPNEKNADEFVEVLRTLIEAGLVDIVIGEDGDASFTLSAAVTDAGLDAIAALLAWIEAITDSRQGA